jgi:quercetin dioxygenase-like cupin family protein
VEAPVTREEFEAELRRDGFAVGETAVEPNTQRTAHAHDFDVRALVLSRELKLGCSDARPRTYRVGDVFTMEAGIEHTEAVGPEGARYLVGRRPKT